MKRRQILLNAVTTIAQTLGNAVLLFFLYRFLIRSIGVDRLGIWSLVLATTSVITLANQGFSTSIVKFVAKYAARESAEEVAAVLQTAVISAVIGVGLVSAGLYPIARWILHLVLPATRLAEAQAILPLAIVSLGIMILEGVLQAGLAGHQLITVCNYLDLGGGLSYLALAIAFVPAHGLLGLAYAQATQGVALLAITWWLLRRRVPALPLLPRRWNRALFRELGGYGVHFQLITSAQALREPVTKALIARFGGLAMTAFYDLAARWVFTLRELAVQANQVLIPTVSHFQESDPKLIPLVYRKSYRLIFFLAVPTFACAAVLGPVVSRVWIGRYEAAFVEFVAILAAGWLANVLANPAYTVDLGTGALKWVSVGCAAAAVLNAGLGLMAGKLFGALGVVAATAISQTVGYGIVVVAYHVENHTSFRLLLPTESRGLLLASLGGALILLPVLCSTDARHSATFGTAAAGAAALMVALLKLMWVHPMRRELFRWVREQVPV